MQTAARDRVAPQPGTSGLRRMPQRPRRRPERARAIRRTWPWALPSSHTGGRPPMATSFENGDPDALLAVVRIGRDSGRALWLGHIRGRLGGGETPRVILYGADDGNAFVLGLMLAGAVEVRGTNETALSLDEPVGRAALIRFEGDGRVRYAGVIKSIEGEVFLGTLLSVQNVWLTPSATGPSSSESSTGGSICRARRSRRSVPAHSLPISDRPMGSNVGPTALAGEGAQG